MRSIPTLFVLSRCALAQFSPVTATLVSTDERFLANGTSKVTTTSQDYRRDAAGRTRTASDVQAVIFDPATRTKIILDLKAQVATVQPEPAAAPGPAATAGVSAASPTAGGRPASIHKPILSLGRQNVAGVPATGFRAEVVMPPGAAGNIQPLRVVSELWRSDDLQIPVKTSTTESNILMSGDRVTRRRTQSYVNIATPSQMDPSLFAIPPGFQVVNSSGH